MSEPTQEAGAETSHSLRRLLLRIGGTLVGLLVLYVLSTGPVAYYVERHQAQHPDAEYPVLERLYAPMEMVFESPVEEYYSSYISWWVELAHRGESSEGENGE